MANMHLVTGFAGREHVTAADHGSLHAALFGSGNFLLDKGGKFALTKISDNLIRIADGDLLMQGRHIRIEDGAYVELAVENGTQGYLRHDLVVARYTKDEDSGVEECNVIILRGDPVGAAPADPAYITGDIINDGATTNDVPLYRLNLNGIEIASVDSLLPAVIPVIPEKLGEHAASIAALQAALAGSTNAKIQTGYYIGTGEGTSRSGTSPNFVYTYRPNSITFGFVPKLVFVLCDDTTNTSSYNASLFNCVGMTSEYLTNKRFDFAGGSKSTVNSSIYTKLENATLTWYSLTNDYQGGRYEQLNWLDVKYYWVAIG